MKKINGVSYEWDSYVSLRKHKCPDCGSKLKTVKVSKVIDRPNSKVGHKTYLVGPVKTTSKEFECPNCGKHLTVREMKEHEGLISDKPLSESEKKSEKDKTNAIVIISTVLIGVILFVIYSLIKSVA